MHIKFFKALITFGLTRKLFSACSKYRARVISVLASLRCMFKGGGGGGGGEGNIYFHFIYIYFIKYRVELIIFVFQVLRRAMESIRKVRFIHASPSSWRIACCRIVFFKVYPFNFMFLYFFYI